MGWGETSQRFFQEQLEVPELWVSGRRVMMVMMNGVREEAHCDSRAAVLEQMRGTVKREHRIWKQIELRWDPSSIFAIRVTAKMLQFLSLNLRSMQQEHHRNYCEDYRWQILIKW